MVKRIILLGLLSGAIMLGIGILVSWVSGTISPSLADEYKNVCMFRSWSDPVMALYFLHPFVLGIILSWTWHKARILFSSDRKWKNGVSFGMVYWLVTIPGMLISYSTFPLSLTMLLSWVLIVLLQAICSALLFAKMNAY